MEVTNGYGNTYDAAEIVDLADGTLDIIKVASYENKAGTDLTTSWNDEAETPEHNIVKYVETDDGYELTDAATAWASASDIENGTPRIALTNGTAAYVVTDNYTVYAVETKCGEYAMYTGYKAVPSIENAGWTEVLDSDKDGFADLVYINAINAIFPGNSVYAFVLPGASDVGGGDGYDLVSKVVVNGEVSTIKVDSAYTATLLAQVAKDSDGKGMTLYINADGEVWKSEVLKYTAADAVYTNSEEVAYLEIAGNGYLADANTVIWLIDHVDGLAEVGDADDLVAGANCYAIVDGANLDKVIVYTDLDA